LHYRFFGLGSNQIIGLRGERKLYGVSKRGAGHNGVRIKKALRKKSLSRTMTAADYKTLFESAPDAYLVLTPDLAISAVSDAYLTATKTDRKTIIGRRLFDVFPNNPDDPDATGVKNLNASLQRVLASRAPDAMPVQKYDIRRPDSEGGGFEEHFWSPLNTPVLSPEGTVLFIIHRVQDVTGFVVLQQTVQRHGEESAEMRAKMELAESEVFLRSQEVAAAHKRSQEAIAELQAFCFSLSHDFRAPIRAIHSFVQIVLADHAAALGPDATHLLKKCITAAQRMDRLIQDVLSFAGLSRKSIPIERVEIEPLLRDIIAERPDFQSPKAQIEIRPPLFAILGHQASLTQCMTNLLSNAVKFVKPGDAARVSIFAEDHGATVRLWFDDQGIGIDPQTQRKLFSLFERGSADGDFQGTGIGLAIVRRAVERMGGTVGVQSEPGKGSRFWLELRKAT
jgi:signal transduction histidine kinase